LTGAPVDPNDALAFEKGKGAVEGALDGLVETGPAETGPVPSGKVVFSNPVAEVSFGSGEVVFANGPVVKGPVAFVSLGPVVSELLEDEAARAVCDVWLTVGSRLEGDAGVAVSSVAPVPTGKPVPSEPVVDFPMRSDTVVELANGADGAGPIVTVTLIPVPDGEEVVRGDTVSVKTVSDESVAADNVKLGFTVMFVKTPDDT
jgi:hypothetical protein